MLYIIETEDCGNTLAVLAIVNKYFQCYKLERGDIGVFEGKPESTLTLKFDDVENERPDFSHNVDSVAYEIKALNKQKSVLVQRWPVNSKLI